MLTEKDKECDSLLIPEVRMCVVDVIMISFWYRVSPIARSQVLHSIRKTSLGTERAPD
jgi:hypothetical protein